jgi:hypothetical protein
VARYLHRLPQQGLLHQNHYYGDTCYIEWPIPSEGQGNLRPSRSEPTVRGKKDILCQLYGQKSRMQYRKHTSVKNLRCNLENTPLF